ncbi:F0F1 ATP synthase subunit delta [Amnibacterium flavum]|uniref:ATP synthase subunit delta n=1 Tax=Amnibacterium flavum TaxID=2173173 RepID=A0A2V1HWG1_9MICO|nr:F0F1 ATP synthase subunit delta [Amnibacterium flavum]PVZ96222.1 F0F1 ATP synthase subunit delta [Amnibacterium flavum]
MGSASRQALETAIAALDKLGSTDLATGERLLAAARAIAGSTQLRALLADPGIEAQGKSRVVNQVFSGFGDIVPVLDAVVNARWSSGNELVDGIETLGYRAVSASAPQGVSVDRELFSFGAAVGSNSELELAVGSNLGGHGAKTVLVDRLLVNASEQTRVIVRHIVQSPRKRRFSDAIRRAASVVADQSGLGVATIRTATALTAAQLDRLEKALSVRYGRQLSINQVVDTGLIGGVRISIGDDVIDGSVATRLNDLRLQLAG